MPTSSKNITKRNPQNERIPINEPLPATLRERIIRAVRAHDDPLLLLANAESKNIFAADFDQSEQSNQKLMQDLIKTFGFETDHSLIAAVPEEYRGLSIELRRNLIKDFSCKTHAEKVLIDTIVSGYLRHLHCARVFNNCIAQGSTTAVLNNFMGVLSKEMDRANRHILTAYQMLVNLKRPPLNVQVKAQQAFVAQAQQFNASKEEKAI